MTELDTIAHVTCCTNVVYSLAEGETILQAANVMGGRGDDSGKKQSSMTHQYDISLGFISKKI